MYGWKEDMERGIEPKGLWEDFPVTLFFYHKVYANFMASYRQDNAQPGKLTRNSFISDNLAIASCSPLRMPDIVRKMSDAIQDAIRQDSYIVLRATEADDDEDPLGEFSFYGVCCDLAEGKPPPLRGRFLRLGFEAVPQNI